MKPGILHPASLAGAPCSAPDVPSSVWGYYNNGRLHFTLDKAKADSSADGFTWDNPRVRKMGHVVPCRDANGLRFFAPPSLPRDVMFGDPDNMDSWKPWIFVSSDSLVTAAEIARLLNDRACNSDTQRLDWLDERRMSMMPAYRVALTDGIRPAIDRAMSEPNT